MYKLYILFWGFFGLSFYVRYSTLLHLPPLRFHCVEGCWDRTQDGCDFGIDSQTCTLTTRLDLIHRTFLHVLSSQYIIMYAICMLEFKGEKR